jgi:metal-responsive CopG/Arc/MetJ family transcriptional regulator
MASKRAHIIIPEELIAEIDRLVGKRGRSRFILEAAADEARRQRQLRAVEKSAGTWKDKDHPELKAGSRAWIRKIREHNSLAIH